MTNVVVHGCPRSGTSILGELFRCLSGYGYQFEPSIDRIIRREPGHPEGERIDFDARPYAFKNPVQLDRPATPGLPMDLSELENIVPPPLAHVWIVRHPLDTAASLLPGLADGWKHPPIPPQADEWLQLPPMERGLNFWTWVNGEGYGNLTSRAKDVLVVHYEQLVAHPVDVAEAVCSYVGYDHPSMEQDVAQWVSQVSTTSGQGEAPHQVRWRRDRASGRHVERWRDILSGLEAQQLWALPGLAEVAHHFGYRPPEVFANGATALL